ncbi:hypothetical protein HanOQP8_Chr00c015g0685451 [Helianthus annuus]|nr:hypothetical protein HanOQP8_Chr00c015g0685451 [Helianthus annuus]
MRRFSESWCDYIVVSDTLEGLAPVALWKPKAEPRDTADIPAPNPDDPIDLESSPEPLQRTKDVKRKPDSEAVAQPADSEEDQQEGQPGCSCCEAFSRSGGREGCKVEKLVEVEAEKVAEAETVDVGVTKPKSPEVVAHEPEKGKSIQGDPVISIPFSATTSAPPRDDVEQSPAGVDQGFIYHDEEDSPIRPEETLGDYYYYRSYSEKRASEIHAPV